MFSEVQTDVVRPEEFERLLEEHMETLYSSALRLTRNATDAKDLLQDVLVRALRFHDKYQKGTYIKAWLLTILRNTFINDYRRRARRPKPVELSRAEDVPAHGADRDMGYYRLRFQAEDLLECLGDETRTAIDALPATHRSTVIMADLQDMSYSEIAAVMGCPLGTVMSRLHRGRRLLREALPDGVQQLTGSR